MKRSPPARSRNASSQAHQVSDGSVCALERALSKLGYCSRSEAHYLVTLGRVQVNGVLCRDPERRVNYQKDQISVDEQPVKPVEKVYLLLNKPRGLITTACDEKGRETVYSCFSNWQGKRVFPVGRLDKASEGLLFFTNDTQWADRITSPESHLDKTYHVQIDRVPDTDLINTLVQGVRDSEVGLLRAKHVSLLRAGEKNAWLEIILDEGRNRQIRRLLEAFEIEVLRLVRVAIGPIPLGTLSKGTYRVFTPEELRQVEIALKKADKETASHPASAKRR